MTDWYEKHRNEAWKIFNSVNKQRNSTLKIDVLHLLDWKRLKTRGVPCLDASPGGGSRGNGVILPERTVSTCIQSSAAAYA